MGVAEELSRLAELRDRGVLTQKEFDQKKRQLLKGGKAGPTRLMQFAAGLVAIVILGSFAYTGLQKWLSKPDENELACDSPEIIETATNVLNRHVTNLKNQFGIFGELALPGIQFHGIDDAEELYRDKQSGFIACLATARGTKGEGQIAYTVTWHDRAIGKFWVELANPAQMQKKYSGRLDDSAEIAPTPPMPPREELLDVLADMKKSMPPEESDDAANDTPSLTTTDVHANSGYEENLFTGRCLLEVGGRRYIDGQCPINESPDGSFSIGAAESVPLRFFATVRITGKRLAEGHWNEEEGTNHAHAPLGKLRFERGCWQNESAKVCAWR
jgi:hypothetical protein